MRKEKFFKKKSFNRFSGLFIVLIVGLITLINSEPLGIEEQFNERDKVEFDIDFIISDEVFTNVNSMSIEQIQSFLEVKNSPLADKHLYQKYYLSCTSNMEIYNLVFPNGKLARESSPAEIIYYAGNLQINPNSRPNLINPQVLLVLLELNQGLIENPAKLDQYTLDNALKYNSLESEYYNPNYQGFLNQLIGLASKLNYDFKYFRNTPEENKPTTIINGMIHFPKNVATYIFHNLLQNYKKIKNFYDLFHILTSGILNVPFKAQVPPGNWNYTRNCGQASCLMVFCYYSGTTPTAQGIKDIDDWLYQRFGDPINNYNGSYTTTLKLVTLAREYGCFVGSHVNSGWEIKQLREEIDAGYPVIVAVEARYLSNRGYIWAGGHFVVAKGYDNAHIICNDPGTSQGNSKYYINN
jgi:hypothetical protein